MWIIGEMAKNKMKQNNSGIEKETNGGILPETSMAHSGIEFTVHAAYVR